jgi:DNA-binding CsgD family transcriptional regulator/tetratricopeptide (TPR) repeat protein
VAAAALAGHALRVAKQAAAGLQSGDGELAAARWLDAEDATMRQALGWAGAHDPALALRLANALGWWWVLRGRLPGEYPLVCQAADAAEAGSGGWCAAQIWLGWAAQVSADLAASLSHFTAVRDAVAGRPPSPALTAALACRATALRLMGRTAEAAGDARSALALAQQIGDPAGELLALAELSFEADYVGDHDEAVRLARQAGQITTGIPGGLARRCSYVLASVLADAGNLAEAARVGAAGLARARAAGDLWNQASLLPRIVELDLRAGRTGDAAAHLREGLHLAVRTGSWFELLTGISQCGDLCAATGRVAEALTLWAVCAAVDRHEGLPEPPDPPWFVSRREEQLRGARLVLGPGRARAAEDRGAAMSMATATEYALLLTDPGPPQPAEPAPGKLSARERELVTLVAQGRTNAQIAGQLYISVRTVGSHLDRIRDKTGCRRRADLTRLALATGLV